MRRITLWLLSTVSTLVLLFSYHTSTSSRAATSVVAATDSGSTGSAGDATATPSPSSSATPSASSGSDGDSSQSVTPTPTSSAPASAASGTDGTFLGEAIGTRYGPVQVQITVTGGKITASEVTQVPWNDRKDQEINSRAVPILNAEAVDAQSAQIDMVSGATFTSRGYVQSLQSAIDQANL